MEKDEEFNSIVTKSIITPQKINAIRKLLIALNFRVQDLNNQYWLRKLNCREVTSSELREMLLFLNEMSNETRMKSITFTDSNYKIINKQEFLKWVNSFWIPKLKNQRGYIPQGRDCDNFALMFHGIMADIGNIAAGTIFGYCSWLEGYHAFNFVFLEENGITEIVLFEPQTGVTYGQECLLSSNFAVI